MSSTVKSGSIVCPFYRYHDTKRRCIGCEGYTDACSIGTHFNSLEAYARQLEVYCSGRYDYCELYRMIYTAKYAEEEEQWSR